MTASEMMRPNASGADVANPAPNSGIYRIKEALKAGLDLEAILSPFERRLSPLLTGAPRPVHPAQRYADVTGKVCFTYPQLPPEICPVSFGVEKLPREAAERYGRPNNLQVNLSPTPGMDWLFLEISEDVDLLKVFSSFDILFRGRTLRSPIELKISLLANLKTGGHNQTAPVSCTIATQRSWNLMRLSTDGLVRMASPADYASLKLVISFPISRDEKLKIFDVRVLGHADH